jgi:hypothetical protein
VLDLPDQTKGERERERAVKILIHDLSDLSYMIEKYSPNALLAWRQVDRAGAPPAQPARGGSPACPRRRPAALISRRASVRTRAASPSFASAVL